VGCSEHAAEKEDERVLGLNFNIFIWLNTLWWTFDINIEKAALGHNLMLI
jgi:hypothetical protein